MTELLELAHLVEKHGVSEMQIRRRRIKTRLDAQRPPAPQLRKKLSLDKYVHRTALDLGELGIEITHAWIALSFAA
jgi:hypothetical protein